MFYGKEFTMKPEQIKILVVDGDDASASKCTEVLATKGYQVDRVGTPQEALTKSAETTYHLVITEMNFNGQASGLEIIQQVRENHRHTCAIVLTSNPTLDGAIQAIQLGVCDYIAKPVQDDRLLDSVNKSLSRRGIYLTSEETINKAIGARLRQLRREQGLTTQQLANRVGVTQSQISQVETGRSAASVVTLYKIAQAFEMCLSEMLEGV
jgi:DNA-binding NtrC family response regulator